MFAVIARRLAACALLLLVPHSLAWAQADRIERRAYKIGFLGQTSAPDMTAQTAALREGLRAAGYDEDRNLAIEYRWAERKLDRLPALAKELVGLKVDLIVTHGSAGARAAKEATGRIPIVIAVIGDPVGNGVVASLARPGGNATGLVLQEFETTVKWLELLKEILPTASRIGWLEVPDVERADAAAAAQKAEDAAARRLGFEVHRVVVRGAGDLPPAIEALAREGVHAVVVPNSSLLDPLAAQIATLTISHRLPAVGSTSLARAGGLIAYGPDGADMYRRAARYVDAIFKGAQPGELPMEGPAKLEMTVNLKTARALGVRVPAALAARADHRID